MLIIVFISAFVVIASGLFIAALLRPRNESPTLQSTRQPQSRGLFDAESTDDHSDESDDAVRRRLMMRLQNGEWSALDDARRSASVDLYRELLDSAVAECTEEKLETLAAHISKSKELRSNALLARRLLERFRLAPSVRSATDMLHISALSDDAEIYHEAVDALIAEWRSGKLDRLTSGDLKDLIESQFWVLAPEARQGGAAYKLKRRLAGIRRELALGEPVR